MVVDSSFDFWDEMTEEEQEQWLEVDMWEAETWDSYHDEFEDFDANTAR